MNGWSRANRGIAVAVALAFIAMIVLLFLLLLADRNRAQAEADAARADLSEIQSQKQGIPGTDGEDGESAYEIAVRLGFVGTEAEWLASLVGPQGPAGTNGKNGTNGLNGAAGGFSTLDIQCIGNHLKLLVNGSASRDLGVYCL